MKRTFSFRVVVAVLAATAIALLVGAKTFAQTAEKLSAPVLTVSVIQNDGEWFQHHLQWTEVPGAQFFIYRFAYHSEWDLISTTYDTSMNFLYSCGLEDFLVVAVKGDLTSGIENSIPVSSFVPCEEGEQPPPLLQWTDPTTSSVRLVWSPVAGATNYQIVRIFPSESYGGSMEVISTTGKSEYVVSLPCGTSMFLNVWDITHPDQNPLMTNQVRVEALPCEEPVSEPVPTEPPATPVPLYSPIPTPVPHFVPRLRLNADHQYGSVILDWDQGSQTRAFTLWFSDSADGEYTQVYEAASWETSFKHVVGCGVSAFYYLKVEHEDGSSEKSNFVSISTYPCLQKPDVSVVQDRAGAVLSWEYDANAFSYVIQKLNQDGKADPLVQLKFGEHSASVAIPCGEQWTLEVIPKVYGEEGESTIVDLQSMPCAVVYFPMAVQNPSEWKRNK